MQAQHNKLGVVSLGGSLPLSLAKSLTESRTNFHLFGFSGITDAKLDTYGLILVPFFKLGHLFAALRAEGCSHVVFAGQFYRPQLHKMRMDMAILRYLPVLLFSRVAGDDTILRKVTEVFEAEGFQVVSLKDIAPNLVAQSGALGQHAFSAQDEADSKTGFDLLHNLGRYDVGQSVVVDHGRVIAVEAAEGTDAMLLRVKEMRGGPRYPMKARSGVLIKAAKPIQELRNDMPVVGLQTVQNVIAAGLGAIALQEGHVLMADLPDTINEANSQKIAVAGFSKEKN